MSSRLVASSCIWMSVKRSGTRSSNHACPELSKVNSPKAAGRGRALRRRGRSGFAFHVPSLIIQTGNAWPLTSPVALGHAPGARL